MEWKNGDFSRSFTAGMLFAAFFTGFFSSSLVWHPNWAVFIVSKAVQWILLFIKTISNTFPAGLLLHSLFGWWKTIGKLIAFGGKLKHFAFPLFFRYRVQSDVLWKHWPDVWFGAASAQRGPHTVCVHPNVHRGRWQPWRHCSGEYRTIMAVAAVVPVL